jgi:hypothetical protein
MNPFKEKLTLWRDRIQNGNNVEMFELTKCCRLDKNLFHLILQSLSLLSKNTEKYFLSLDVIFLGLGERYICVKLAELTFAEEDMLMDIRNDRRLKLKYSSTDMASFWLSLQQEYPIITKKATEALLPFSTSYLWGWIFCYEHDQQQEQVAASNTG